MKLEERLRETPARHHDHFVDSVAYMVAGMEAKLLNDYCLLYIKQRPWWLPEIVYRWMLKRILVLAHFK